MSRGRMAAAGRYLLTLLALAVLIPLTGSVWARGLLFLTLLLPPVSLCCNLYVRRHLEAQLRLPTTAAKKSVCEAAVVLKNGSLLPAVKLCCRLEILNDLTGEREMLEFTSAVGSGQESSHAFQLSSEHCGRLYVHMQSVKILDWFGLFSLNVPIKAGARMTVLPELFSCDVELTPVASTADDGSADRRGDDRTEVFQLREYQAGDDVRQIHWKLSSKLDSLILREPGQSISRSVLVFWDKRWECPPRHMDAMAETAASVCQALADRGIPFDLCWTEAEELELRQIADADTLLQTIPALVTRAGEAECSLPDMEDYGRVLYIGAQPPEEQTGEQVFCLICTEEEQEARGMLAFTPETYQERLERLEI